MAEIGRAIGAVLEKIDDPAAVDSVRAELLAIRAAVAEDRPGVEWRPVAGFEGYEVSAHGQVRVAATGMRPVAWRDEHGLRVRLRRNGRIVQRYVHSLVAVAFLGAVSSASVNVTALDGDRANATVDNLRVAHRVPPWRDRSESVAAPPVDDGSEWRPVVGVPGYEVSSLGRVRPVGSPTALNGWADQWGRRVKLRHADTGQKRSILVHVLVAEAFLGPVPAGSVVDAIDGNKAHAAVANLRIVARVKPAACVRAPRERPARPPKPPRVKAPPKVKAPKVFVPRPVLTQDVAPAGPPVVVAPKPRPAGTQLANRQLICQSLPGADLDDVDRDLMRRDSAGRDGWMAHRWRIPVAHLVDRSDPTAGDHVCVRCGARKPAPDPWTAPGMQSWRLAGSRPPRGSIADGVAALAEGEGGF